MTLPSGGVSGPPGPDPLPEEVSNGDEETSMSGSFGSLGITVNGIAITGSSILMPRVPPYASARLAPMLAARLAELSLDRAVHVDEATDEALLGCGGPLTGSRDLGGLDSAPGSLFTISAGCRGSFGRCAPFVRSGGRFF